MSLREEIAILYVRKRKNQIGTELADEIINKILDAAVEAHPGSNMCASEILISWDQAYELGVSDMKWAINKLRGEE